jgi:hypothetical protein
MAQLVEALRYKPEGCGFNSVEVNGIFELIHPAAIWYWGRLSH